MRHIKYAPKLRPINEDLTASMMRHKEREAPVLKSKKRQDNNSKVVVGSTGIDRDAPQVPDDKKNESPSENLNTAEPVALEPIRQRADTAITAPPSTASLTMAANGPSANKYGRSVLHDAVRKGDVSAVQHILISQPDLLRQPDKRGNQPLHYAANAATKNASQILYCLLKAGAFSNAVNERQQTPLVIQVISNENDDDMVVRILLHYNARPRLKVTESMMLPQFANSRGLHKIATALYEYM